MIEKISESNWMEINMKYKMSKYKKKDDIFSEMKKSKEHVELWEQKYIGYTFNIDIYFIVKKSFSDVQRDYMHITL